MAVLVFDTFDRANSDTVGNDSNGNAWQEDSGDWDISSNGVIQTDAVTNPGCLRCGTDTASTNHWIEARLARSTGANQIGLLVRLDATDFTAISVEVADGNYKIIRVNAGSPDTGDVGAAHAHVTGEVYAASITSGNTYTLYLDGVSVFTGTEAHNAGDTRVGFHINESASGVIRWDDMRAGDGAYPGPDWPWKDRKTEVGTSLGTANAMPAFTGAASGDLAIWAVANDNPGVTDITGSTGWDKIVATGTAGSNVVKAAWFARVLDGGANDTLSVSGASQDYCCQGILIDDSAHGVTTVTTDIEVVAAATGTSGNADPPSLDTGASGDWLFFATGAVDATTGNLITAGPTNMSLVGTPLKSANSTSSVMLGMSYLVQAGATLDPGTFENNSQEWVGQTIAIPRAASATNLVVADAAQAQTADNVALTQTHVLTIQDATQAQATDSVALTQVHELVVQDAAQAQTADNVVLEVSGATNLVVQNAAQGQTADNVSLTQTHQLSVADAAQAQAADSLTLTQVHSLAVADATQAQAADTPALTQVHALTVQDAAQGHTADNVVLTVGGVDLIVAGALHAQSADGVVLTQVHQLVVADATQTQSADSPALTQNHVLTVADALQSQTADNVVLFLGDLPVPSGHSLSAGGQSHAVTAAGGSHAVTVLAGTNVVEVR